jgi:hypothetical protein
LPTPKKICKVKKCSSPTIWHNSLAKSRSILHQERNKIMFVPFHLFKTYIRNPYLFFISFFTLPPTEKRRWQPCSARAYRRAGRWVLPSFYFSQIGSLNCWMPTFLILPKLGGCQFNLPYCWSCSNNICSLRCLDWGVIVYVHVRERVVVHHNFSPICYLSGGETCTDP